MRSKVVFLDDSADLRELMADIINIKLDKDCLCFARLSDFENQIEAILSADLAILDINLGPNEPTGIDAYHWLKQKNFKGAVVFLTGHARANPMIVEMAKLGIPVLEKPIESLKLLSIIAKSKRSKT